MRLRGTAQPRRGSSCRAFRGDPARRAAAPATALAWRLPPGRLSITRAAGRRSPRRGARRRQGAIGGDARRAGCMCGCWAAAEGRRGREAARGGVGLSCLCGLRGPAVVEAEPRPDREGRALWFLPALQGASSAQVHDKADGAPPGLAHSLIMGADPLHLWEGPALKSKRKRKVQKKKLSYCQSSPK